MISPENFKEMMALIADRTPNSPSPSTLAVYYQLLSPRMSDAEFREAGLAIFQSTEFFPPPVRFLEIVSSKQWPLVLSLLQEFTPPHVPDGWHDRWMTLTEDSRQTIVQLGGPLATRDSLNKNIDRLRQTFVKVYEEVARDACVAESLASTEQPPLLESGE